ncbi:ubiquinol-cytochrome c reductase iron-sulfur subunit [Fuerstiella marisgermanici]|uniref:Cytochrome b6-f complex iron-sulfur subunit n=1 Tax=Fuerstiella marisgermanici TaxID=1891926 RepID=A0A1P8WDA0_9PLAN|nr:Rieske (2Fe-2S) protein [Fuerstiella marisgermanici]APZ92046.1 Cytochrome b6-f complex iron-sulfur subunit [Fuerstiella marisgermanici]
MGDTNSPDTSAPAETPSDAELSSGSESRRNALVSVLTGFLSFVIVAIPSFLAGAFYLDPILRRKKSGGAAGGGALDGFIKLDATTDSLPDDGTPVAVTVKSTLDDAWNRFKDVPVGSVWLRKQPDGSVIAFNSICPHLGCSVNYRRSDDDFFCPCHTSSFDLDGTKTNEVPPRNMDELEIITATDGEPGKDGKELWLKFQNFRGATEQKIPV